MRFRWIRTIYLKEMLEALRDRRTLFLMVGVPLLLYPILFLTLGAFTESYLAELATRTTKIALWGDIPVDLTQKLAEDEDLPVEIVAVEVEDSEDICAAARRALIAEEVEVILRLDPKIRCESREESEDEGNGAPLGRFEILFDGANLFSDQSQSGLRSLLGEYSRRALRDRLSEAGLDPELVIPYDIDSVNLAGEQRMSGHYAGRVLPSIIIMMVILGAFYPAIDLTAGEKERSTLETLISAPVRTSEIVAGKYLAVVTIALIASGVNLVSMGLTINRMASQLVENGGTMALTVGGGLTVFLLMIPSALFFSAVLFANACLARSFKEAQNLLTPTFLVMFFPAMIALLPGMELNPVTVFAPVINIALVIKQTLIGELNLDAAFAVLLANTVYAIIALTIAGRLFGTEGVLFSEDRPWRGWRVWLSPSKLAEQLRRPVSPGRVLSPGGAALFFAVTLVLLYYVATALQAREVLSGLLITEWILLLGPAVLVTYLWRLDFRETFSLRLPSAKGFLGTLLVAVSAWTLGLLGAAITEFFLPMPQAFVESMREFFNVVTENLTAPAMLFLVAVSPAVCEEAAFRGVILSGFKGRLARWQSVVLVGLLFGVFHLSIYRFLPTALLGMLITYVVLETGSILSAVIIHFGVNATVFSAGIYPRLSKLLGLSAEEGTIESWPRLAIFGVLLVAGLWIVRRGRKK
jgi:sodium transport system permease protein